MVVNVTLVRHMSVLEEVFFEEDFIFIKTAKPNIINSFGIRSGDGVRVSIYEMFFLCQRGYINWKPIFLVSMDHFLVNFAVTAFNCVSDLKLCNYIINDRQHCLDIYYPTLRTRKLIESCSPIELSIKEPFSDYDQCFVFNKHKISLVCLSGIHNSNLFIQISDFSPQEFVP